MPLHHKILLLGLAALTLLAVYVPWNHVRGPEEWPAGYAFLFSPPGPGYNAGVRVDLVRTLIPLGVVALLTATLAWITWERGPR